MSFNPLEEKGTPIEKQYRDWRNLNPIPYDKTTVHPYTRARIILMNGIETEAAMFLHQFNRHCDDMEVKKVIAESRRIEQQQQKAVNYQIPADETLLEVTIGYEQVAVDLTAWLAQNEKDENVKQALDFALLEDFDHLYRYADLMDLECGIKAERVVQEYTEITPGRPTAAHHRHPQDEIRKHINKDDADIQTKLNILTIVAGEQQTMNFYMNNGNRHGSNLGRGLYMEIGQVEEQHVSHYESLNDPNMSWYEMLLMHEYTECWLYYSMYKEEVDEVLKKLWEQHLYMEIGHLNHAVKLLKEKEGKEAKDMLPKALPSIFKFQSNKEYIRKILEEQIHLTTQDQGYVSVKDLDENSRFRTFNKKVNNIWVPSNEVIKDYIFRNGMDYRFEIEGENPIKELQDRTTVIETLAIK